MTQEENTLKLDEPKLGELINFSEAGCLRSTGVVRLVGESGRTLMEITPDGEILLGKNRLPLDVLLEGLENTVAALKMLRDCYCSHEKDGK